jgi:hypothetical protein
VQLGDPVVTGLPVAGLPEGAEPPDDPEPPDIAGWLADADPDADGRERAAPAVDLGMVATCGVEAA